MTESPSTSSSRFTPLVAGIYALLFVSGALGLMYEVLWLRKLLLVFGSSVHAVSTVLTVFFGGLALGSWLFGRLIDRASASGLLWYAACEAAIGIYAWLTPPLFGIIERLYIPLYRASGYAPGMLVGAGFVCCVAVLLIPTVLMGATLPLISRALVRVSAHRGTTIAGLYAVNTAGAMAGTLFVYWVALQTLGWMRSLLCAGLTSVLIGLIARVLDRQLRRLSGFPTADRPSSDIAGPLDRGPIGWLMLSFGLSGFSAMVYEVAWTRSLSLVLGSSIYAFCLMLATFLGGIALGSLAARQWLRRHTATLWHCVALEIGLGLYGLFSVTIFGHLPQAFVTLWPLVGESFTALAALQILLSLAVMALPTLMMGALFPLVADLVTRRFASLGQRLGEAYAINTLGGVAGSFLSGFWLIPAIGLAQTLVLAGLVNLLAGIVLDVRFHPAGWRRRLAPAALSLAAAAWCSQAIVVPSWQRAVLVSGAYLDPIGFQGAPIKDMMARGELLFYRESLNATVSVHRSRTGDVRNLFLKVGGKTDASTTVDMGTQLLSAHLPLILHGPASRVLVVGLGSGVTLGAAAQHPVDSVECAELDPAVIEAAKLFGDYNHHVHENPKVRIRASDGRNLLLAGREPYDVIISEPSNPWMAGVATLFTKEYYELAKRRLAPGGVMCQWLQLYRIFPEDVKLILKTFQSVFPYMTVWSTVPGDIVLIGSQQPLLLPYHTWAERVRAPAVQEDLQRVKLTDPRVLLELCWLGPEQVAKLVTDETWVHDDDNLVLEFNAPKALYQQRAFQVNYGGLRRFRVPPSSVITDLDTVPRDAAFYQALGLAYRERRETESAREAFEQATRLDPRDAQSWAWLGEVYLTQGLALKAQEALLTAIATDPSLLPASLRLADLLIAQDQRDRAIAVYDAAAGAGPAPEPVARALGIALADQGRLVEAAECLRSALSQEDSPSPKAVLTLAKALNDLRQPDEAARWMAVIHEKTPASSWLPLAATIAAQAGETRDAQARWEQAAEQIPDRAEAYFGLGRLALADGRREQAAHYFRLGLRYDPYNVTALESLQRLQDR